MTPADWQRINEIFDHVVDKSPSHRRDYLDMVLEDEPELRDEVERLLAASDALDAEGTVGDRVTGPLLERPSRIGAYVVGEHLGSGGMGDVYRAVHPQYGAVALKLLPSFLVSDDAAMRRFENEAAALAALSHPVLCRLFEYFVADGYAAIAMEDCGGIALGELLQSGPLDPARALDCVRNVAAALDAAHAAKVLHRDLKPGNLLVSASGTPPIRLIDFGIAKFADVKLTATGQAIGSPNYMSPEQWRGQPVDRRTDLWSLGVVWYEMLTATRPFGGDGLVEIAARVMTEPHRPLPDVNTRGDEIAQFATTIDRLLEKDPAKRLPDCRSLLSELGRFEGAPGTQNAYSSPISK